MDPLTAWSTLATAVFTAALAVMAFLAWRAAKNTLEASRAASRAAREANDAAKVANEQARLDSIAQTRPYVFAEVIPGLAGSRCNDVRISNTGRP